MVLIKEVSPRGTSYPKDGQQLWNKKDGRDDANWFGILFLEKVQKEEDDEDKDGVKEERCEPRQKLLRLFLRKANILFTVGTHLNILCYLLHYTFDKEVIRKAPKDYKGN